VLGGDASPRGAAGLGGLEFVAVGDAAPMSKMISRRLRPMGTSMRPVRSILPARAKTFVPLLFSVPMEAYHSPPLRMMAETLA